MTICTLFSTSLSLSPSLTLTLNFSFISHSSQSHCFRFSRVNFAILHPNLVPSLTLARPLSASRLSAAEFAMAESASSSNSSEYAEIVLVRHGETAWNASGTIQGHLDIELNEAGRRQAAAVADRLSKETKISFIYSSDLKRALETAEIIASRCGLEVIQDPSLRERNLGDLQGHTLRDAAKVCPEAYEAIISTKYDQELPGGGESRAQLSERSIAAMKKIGRMHIGQRIVVVTHGGFMRALHKWACPNSKPVGKVLNTSVNTFRFSDKNKWTLQEWGDVSHLEQSEYLQSGFGGDQNSG